MTPRPTNTSRPTITALDDLARRLERLAPSHRDPFRFHAEKSEIVDALRTIAASIGERA